MALDFADRPNKVQVSTEDSTRIEVVIQGVYDPNTTNIVSYPAFIAQQVSVVSLIKVG